MSKTKNKRVPEIFISRVPLLLYELGTMRRNRYIFESINVGDFDVEINVNKYVHVFLFFPNELKREGNSIERYIRVKCR